MTGATPPSDRIALAVDASFGRTSIERVERTGEKHENEDHRGYDSFFILRGVVGVGAKRLHEWISRR